MEASCQPKMIHTGEAVQMQLTAGEMPQGRFTPLNLLGMDYNALLEKISTDRATVQHFLFGTSLSLIQACQLGIHLAAEEDTGLFPAVIC